MTRRALGQPLGLLLAVFAVACGGEDRGRPSGKPPELEPDLVDPCAADDGYEFQNIVDFDYIAPTAEQAQCDPAVFIPTSAQDPSCMYLNYDSAHSYGGADCQMVFGPSTYPEIHPGTARNVLGDPIDGGGRCGSQESALHLVAENIATCVGSNGLLGWGASLEVLLSTSESLGGDTGGGGAGGSGDGPAPGVDGFDAREWDGISFWFRWGGGPSGQAFIMTVSDPATGGVPYCSTAEGVPDAEKCDAFGTALTITDQWTFATAPFSALRQKGFGVPSPFGTLDQGNIVRLNFLVSAGYWDIWLDNVAFYRRPK